MSNSSIKLNLKILIDIFRFYLLIYLGIYWYIGIIFYNNQWINDSSIYLLYLYNATVL